MQKVLKKDFWLFLSIFVLNFAIETKEKFKNFNDSEEFETMFLKNLTRVRKAGNE